MANPLIACFSGRFGLARWPGAALATGYGPQPGWNPPGQPGPSGPPWGPGGAQGPGGPPWGPGGAPGSVPPGPPRRSRRTRNLIILAVAVVVIVVVAVVVVIVTEPYAGPGHPQLANPSAVKIFDKPFTAGLRSAHVTIDGSSGTGDVKAQGTVLFQPARAMELTINEGGNVTRTIDINDLEYTMSGGARKWSVGAGQPYPYFWHTEWTWPQQTSRLQLAGQARVGGDMAWHLVDKDGPSETDWWIREKDGYPLEITADVGGGGPAETYTFSGFNSPSAQVQAPPQSTVSTRQLTGTVGSAVQVPWAQVTVAAVNSSYTGSGGPPPGYRFVAVQLKLRNTSSSGWTLSNLPDLTDSTGLSLDQIDTGPAPQLGAATPGALRVAAGATAQGWRTFQVPAHDSGLTLHVYPPDGGAGGPLANDLITVPVG